MKLHSLPWIKRSNENQVIEISENGNEIGDQVDRAEGISRHSGGEDPRLPGDSWVSTRKIQGIHLKVELSGLLFPKGE